MLHALFQVDLEAARSDLHKSVVHKARLAPTVSLPLAPLVCHGEEAMLQQMAPSAVGRRLITSQHPVTINCVFLFSSLKNQTKNTIKK
jgi:hypothetical protein